MGGTGSQTGSTIARFELLQTSQSTVGTSQGTGPSSALSQSQYTALAGKGLDAGEASASDTTKTGSGAGLGVGLPLLTELIVALLPGSPGDVR